MSLFYFAAWTDSGCFLGCDHEHPTIISATACINCAGGYVVAVENGAMRALNDKEEIEFQHAKWGAPAEAETQGVGAFNPLKWKPEMQN